MKKYLVGILLIGFVLGKNPSIYIFNFKKSGIKDKRVLEAIKNNIQKTFRKSKKYTIAERGKVVSFIKQNKVDLKNCEIDCLKNIGFQCEVDYLITGKVKKVGSNWNLELSIIEVNKSTEPYLVNVKSKGSMKLMSKLDKKLNKYILKLEDEMIAIHKSSEKNDDSLTNTGKTLFYNVPIYVDQKCGYYYKADFSNANVVKNWYGTFVHPNNNYGNDIPLTGTFYEWYTEEIMKNEIIFEKGILKSFNHWDKDGTQLIFDGNGYYKEYWYDDVLLMEGRVENGLLNGQWKFYYGGGTSFPETLYYEDSETGKFIENEIILPENAILIGDSINENLTYPIRLKPNLKNRLLAIVDYKNNSAQISLNGHENWLDFIPLGLNHKWFDFNGQLIESTVDSIIIRKIDPKY